VSDEPEARTRRVVLRQPGAPLLARSNINRDEGCRHATGIRSPLEFAARG
jgi:hypothetical protein